MSIPLEFGGLVSFLCRQLRNARNQKNIGNTKNQLVFYGLTKKNQAFLHNLDLLIFPRFQSFGFCLQRRLPLQMTSQKGIHLSKLKKCCRDLCAVVTKRWVGYTAAIRNRSNNNNNKSNHAHSVLCLPHTTMKTATFLLALGSVSAFAPSQSASRGAVSRLSATAELDGLIGTDIESGKKIVSFPLCTVPHLRVCTVRCGAAAHSV
jgi:hypothetical protein